MQRKDGTVVSRSEPTPINPTPKGEFIRLFGFRPDGRTPGDYELVLTVRDDTSGQSRNLREPFTIESTAIAAEPTPAPAGG